MIGTATLGGFLHIQAELVHTTAGKDLWHLFSTTRISRWMGLQLRTERGRNSCFVNSLTNDVAVKAFWSMPTQLVLHWETNTSNSVNQVCMLRTHNKTGIQKRSYRRSRRRNQWGLRTPVQPFICPWAQFKLSSLLLLV